MHRGPVVRFLGGAAAAATASAAAMTATTQLVAADDRMPEVGCQTAASATIGVTATGPGTHAPATTMAAVTVARRRLPWAGARSRVVYGGREVAIEVDGPSHFYGRRSGRTPTGATALKRRQLRAAGWVLLPVPYWEWDGLSSKSARQEYLREALRHALPAADAQGLPLSGRKYFAL